MANTNVKNCDLVVLGAGGAGLIAAVKAKDLGVKEVLVLEKAEKTGGCTWFSGAAPMPDNSTPVQRDDLFRLLMKHLYWNVNPKLIRNAIEVSAPLWNWFSSVCDVTDMYPKRTAAQESASTVKMGGADETDPRGIMTSLVAGGFVMGEGERQINKKSKDPSIGPGSAGSWGVTKLLEACEKMGIKILTSTRATDFITDARGSVTGVFADTRDGRLQVNCKACVIATGGFGADMDKLKKRWPTLLGGENRFHRFSCPTDTGDAIEMAEKIGIKVDWENMNILLGGVAHHPYSGSIVEFVRNPEIVFVNLNGERFVDEDLGMGSTYIMTKQPKSQMYFIADHDMVDMFGKRNITGRQPARDAMLKDYWKDVEYEVSLDEGGAPGNHTKSSDTLEGLAKKMGVDPKTFVKTIETYNQYCDNKRDLDFAKKPEYLIPVRKPPFYAFFGQRFLETTHGGLVVNENMEVLRDRDKKDVVPGLFSAGDASGGWTVDKPLPPISAGAWMPNSGYMAGIAAAKYLGFVTGV